MKSAKRKGGKGASKSAGGKSTWGETIKKAIKDKRAGSKGPAQPKPRDSGTFKVRKNAF